MPGSSRLCERVCCLHHTTSDKYTAKDRPSTFGLTSMKVTNHMRLGTGNVDVSVPPPPKYNARTTCLVQTAAHVVMDDDEAMETTVELFFTDDSNRGNVVKAKGISCQRIDIKNDICYFWCEVDDVITPQIIKNRLGLKLFPFDASCGFKLSSTVSKTHGTAQKVSFGKVLSARASTSPMYSKMDALDAMQKQV